MDHQSEQPMLGSPAAAAKPEVVDMENQKAKKRRTPLLKTQPNKWLILAIVLVSLLCLIFFITICVIATGDKPETCLTPQCLRSASNFLDSMDTSIEPCDNFYEYVCGKWNREHFIRQHYTSNSWFTERAWVVEKDAINFLEEDNKPSEPDTVKKARLLYKGCMDFDAMSEVGLQTLSEFMTKDLKIGVFPPLPGGRTRNITVSLADVKSKMNLDVFFGMSVNTLPHNNSIMKLYISAPETHLLRSSLKSRVDRFAAKATGDEEEYDYDEEEDDGGDEDMAGDEGEAEEDDDEIENQDTVYYWRNEVSKFMSHLYMMFGHSTELDSKKIATASWDLHVMKKRFNKIRGLDHVQEDPTNNKPVELTVYELQAALDKPTSANRSHIQLLTFFRLMYPKIGLVEFLKSNETLLVSNLVYLTEVSKYLDGLKPYQRDLWIWWKVIYTLGPHVDKYTLQLMNSIDEADGEGSKSSRAVTCSNLVVSLVKSAASYMVMREPNSEVKRTKVKEMLSYIKKEFVSLVNKISWMDEETKAKTLEKVAAMKEFIAYPEERKNLTYLNSDMEDYEVNETNHLRNFLDILGAINSLEDLSLLKEPRQQSMAEQFDSLDTNAYYLQVENSIYIPGGILQFPFYDLGLEALNYGSIGAILGHELTHGFDNEGRKYDKNGNVHEWWTEKSDAEYQKRIPCYIKDYGSFYVESVNMTVDGNLTLGENIADSGGVLEAFNAYQEYVKDHGPELKLPGFEGFTSNQLFFMSNAMTWCSEYTTESLIEALEDEHSPDFVRTLVTLRDSPQFAKAWNCPRGSKMNPVKEKCQLWVD